MGLGPDHVGGLAGRDHGRPRARFPCSVMRDGTRVWGLDGADYLFFGRVAGENLGNPAQNLKTRDELLTALHESYAYGVKVGGDLTEAI